MRRDEFIDQVDKFGAGFFSISLREAADMDPRRRLALEASMSGVFIGLQRARARAGRGVLTPLPVMLSSFYQALVPVTGCSRDGAPAAPPALAALDKLEAILAATTAEDMNADRMTNRLGNRPGEMGIDPESGGRRRRPQTRSSAVLNY